MWTKNANLPSDSSTFRSRRCQDLRYRQAWSVSSSIPIRRHMLTAAAASEVSSILEGRIAGTSAGGDVQETGRVLSE